MLEQYRPVLLLAALWPTQEFEFPENREDFGARLRATFTEFNEAHHMLGEEAKIPPDVPRVVLFGDGRRWTLELAPGRVNLRRDAYPGVPLEALFAHVRDRLLPIHAWLAETQNLRVYRLGLLVHLFCHTRSSANQKIADYFLQPRALAGGPPPHEIQLGVLTRPVLGDGTVVNRWVRVHPLRTVDPLHVDFAAQVEVDMNTLPENTQVKTGRDIAAFFEAVQRHIENLPVLNDEDFFA